MQIPRFATIAQVLRGTSTSTIVTPAGLQAKVDDVHSNVARIATGTYTGDGTTSQGITGIGFQPSYVKIWERATTDLTNISLFETTDTIIDDNANGGGVIHLNSGAHRFDTHRIISLDADGFTVDDGGGDRFPNANGVTYNYMAMG